MSKTTQTLLLKISDDIFLKYLKSQYFLFILLTFKGCNVNYNGTGYLRTVRTENATIHVSGLTALHLASDSGHVNS